MSHLDTLCRSTVALAALALTMGAAQAESIIGLTSTNALTVFDSANPSNAMMPVTITGLGTTNERIIGIDLRPSTGRLYGLSNTQRLYTLDANTGMATFVANLMADPSDATSPFTSLQGQSIGIDFNPVPDSTAGTPPSLRVMTDAGQNLRINVNPGKAGLTITDGNLNGATQRIDAVAYINNDTNPSTGTALYGIDAMTDMLYSLVANTGAATAVGSLGMDAIGVAGFDVSGLSGVAFAALTNGATGKSGLARINLATGAATWVGDYGVMGNTAIAAPLLDLAVAAVPEPETYALLLAGLGVVAWRQRHLQRRGTATRQG
jgi:Domain of unknown function (DUF4394)/PEP-CTERM motif